MASSSHPSGEPQRQQQHHKQPQHQPMASSSLPTNPIASPVASNQTSIVDENLVVMDYKPPGSISSPDDPGWTGNNAPPANKRLQYVYNPIDGSVLLDHNGVPLTVDRLLATKPLRHELSTRPGPGNKKLTYISGDDVSRTLNDIFGFDGWDLDIQDVSRADSSKDPKTGKHTVVYTARVRLTHKASGAYKEDCGAGDSTDRVYGTAIAHALKASITDAMKRAARHFGDKLGNSLYSGNFSISKAPVSLKDALDKYDIHRCNTKFGFQKPNVAKTSSAPSKMVTASANHPSVESMPPPTTASHASRQKSQQEQLRQGGAPVANTATTSGISGSRGNPMDRQYQNNSHRQSQHQQGQHPVSNIRSSTNPESAAHNQQIQSNGTNYPAPNSLGSSNNKNHHQQQSSNSGIARFNKAAQPKPGMNTTSLSTGMPASTIAQPTSSYGNRSAVTSNNSGDTNYNNANSGNMAASGPYSSTAATAGPPLNPNNNNNGRRVSLEKTHQHPQQYNSYHPLQQQQQQQRQSMSVSIPQSDKSNGDANVPLVSQTPSNYSSGGSVHTYSNQSYKRPPLGAIVTNPTVFGVSSEPASKRPKQQRHHNPYNQTVSGRKSI